MDYRHGDELKQDVDRSDVREDSGEHTSIFAALRHAVRDVLADQLSALEERMLRRVADVVERRLEHGESATHRELSVLQARLARLEERAIDMQGSLAELEGDLKRRRRANFS